MAIVWQIGLLCVVAHICGALALVLRQPRMIGQMVGGLLIGPQFLGLIHFVPALAAANNIATLVIVGVAVFEISVKDSNRQLLGKGLMIGLIGFFIPLGCGYALGRMLAQNMVESAILGTCISVTALPITIKILDIYKLTHTRLCLLTVTAAVVNNLLALIMLGCFTRLEPTMPILEVVSGILHNLTNTCLFLGLVGVTYQLLNGPKATALLSRAQDGLWRHVILGMAVLLLGATMLVGDWLGTHQIIAVFFGALLSSTLLSQTRGNYSYERHRVDTAVNWLFAPLFFACVGLHCNVTVWRQPLLPIAIIIVAIASKALAGWLGAKIAGLSKAETLATAILLNGRGIMEMVVADLAYQHGLIDANLFSSLIFMGVITTMVTPMLFARFALNALEQQQQQLKTEAMAGEYQANIDFSQI